MPPSLTYTQQPWTETYSEIIDVRSPSEFATDHIPCAINLPVLNDAERAEVGTIYKQVCPFTARKIGAALVSKNIYHHLSQHFAAKDPDYRPLIYCSRGGQRSSSMALVLTQIGWPVAVLEGGYNMYRTYVRQQLEQLPKQFTYQILSGFTGSGKTYILGKMRERGCQVLDLEALANHRGSWLGEEWQGKLSPQPSQKYFETLILEQLQKFNPHQPVWVESESPKIGKIFLPPCLWVQMQQANCVEVQLPITARVQFLLQEYPHLVNHPHILQKNLEKLKSRCGWEKFIQWYQLIHAGEWELFVQDILQSHYDPTYNKSIKRYFNQSKLVLDIPDLSDRSLDILLDALLPNPVAVK